MWWGSYNFSLMMNGADSRSPLNLLKYLLEDFRWLVNPPQGYSRVNFFLDHVFVPSTPWIIYGSVRVLIIFINNWN